MKEPIFYRAVRGTAAFIFKAIYKPSITGKKNIPDDGRIVLAGNHTHIFDCLLVGCATKRVVHFLAKDELMKFPLNLVFKPLGIIPVNRRTKDKAALANAVEVLNDDKVIGIFPEGTINRTDDVIMPFKFGAVKMAQETNSKIVPFTITGQYKKFERNIKIKFHEPLSIAEDLGDANGALMDIVSTELRKEGFKCEKA